MSLKEQICEREYIFLKKIRKMYYIHTHASAVPTLQPVLYVIAFLWRHRGVRRRGISCAPMISSRAFNPWICFSFFFSFYSTLNYPLKSPNVSCPSTSQNLQKKISRRIKTGQNDRWKKIDKQAPRDRGRWAKTGSEESLQSARGPKSLSLLQLDLQLTPSNG